MIRSFAHAFRAHYGESPLHLLGALASFAIVGAGVAGWFNEPVVSLKYILIWFAGAAVAHDLLLLPIYSALDRLAAMRRRRHPGAGDRAVPPRPGGHVYVRVPVMLSGLLLLVFAPEILRLGNATYHVASGQHQNVYLVRYLLIVAALFTLSALAYLRNLTRPRAE